MFNKGDKIVYGQTGVCIVEDIAQRELIKHVKRLYYKLRPIYQQNNIIYAPAESDKVLIRPVISKDEAAALIKKMPEIYGDASQSAEDGEFGFANCEELAATAVRIHRKKRAAKSAHKRLGFTDEKNLEHAERLLFGELAEALEIDVNEVPDILFAAIKE